MRTRIDDYENDLKKYTKILQNNYKNNTLDKEEILLLADNVLETCKEILEDLKKCKLNT